MLFRSRFVLPSFFVMNSEACYNPVVTVQECNDAFGILADWEINGQGDRSPAEKEFIASLSEAPEHKAGMEMTM